MGIAKSVFILDGLVISPPNVEPLTPLPNTTTLYDKPEPADVLQLCCYISAHPFLPFIPSPA